MPVEYLNRYREWLAFPGLDEEIKNELLQIYGDEKEIASRFSRELKFGTGGIRAKMGAGTARINLYIVRRVTEGLARFMAKRSAGEGQQLRAVIAYDTRHNSKLFAREAASVLVRWKMKVYLFAEPAPTPLLSFAVRELKATAGVVITASHNPPCDNGYKVYWSDGGQITDGLANAITTEIAAVENELAVKTGDLGEAESQGLLVMIGEEINAKYLDCLRRIRLGGIRGAGQQPLKVVFTPLHGTGDRLVPRALREAGITELLVVSRQEEPDPSCSTVSSPNPEDWDVFKLAISLGRKSNADLLLATDLDADRLGVAVKDGRGNYFPLTGNQLGGLLLEYILSRKKEQGALPPNGLVLKTVVTSEMGRAIAFSYGLEIMETLTGFKYIGEKIKELVDNGRNVFLFGYEESYGYLAGDFVRDKDAVQACQLTAEMAAFYKARGMTLLEALEQLFEKYGYFAEELVNLELAEGEMERVEKIMNFFRQGVFKEIGGRRVVRLVDYLARESFDLIKGQKTPTGLPASNSLKYILERGCWFCIRPSGTEPKMKIYLGVEGSSSEEAGSRMASLKEAVLELVNKS